MEKVVEGKDRDLASFTKIVKKKKEFEQLVIKASQEVRKKEEECVEKGNTITKA